jgi:uncharacterized protein (TIGR03000 family)
VLNGPFRSVASLGSLAALLACANSAPAQVLDRVFNTPVPYYTNYTSDGRYGPPPVPAVIIPGAIGYPYQRHYGGMYPGIWSEENPLPIPPAKYLPPVALGPGDIVYTATPVTVEVHVPDPAAVVTIDGQATKSEGSVRRFCSPPLPPSQNFSYEIRAAWKQDGVEVVRSRVVAVRAGTKVTVTFKQPAALAPPPTPVAN